MQELDQSYAKSDSFSKIKQSLYLTIPFTITFPKQMETCLSLIHSPTHWRRPLSVPTSRKLIFFDRPAIRKHSLSLTFAEQSPTFAFFFSGTPKPSRRRRRLSSASSQWEKIVSRHNLGLVCDMARRRGVITVSQILSI